MHWNVHGKTGFCSHGTLNESTLTICLVRLVVNCESHSLSYSADISHASTSLKIRALSRCYSNLLFPLERIHIRLYLLQKDVMVCNIWIMKTFLPAFPPSNCVNLVNCAVLSSTRVLTLSMEKYIHLYII